MQPLDTLFLGIFIVLIVFVVLVLTKKIKLNKSITTLINPTRTLTNEDLKAIQFLELDSYLSVDLILLRKLPKGKRENNVWTFDNINFSITSVYRYKRIVYHFYLFIDGKAIEVVVPDIFLPYLYEGGAYTNKTIEILYRKEFFVLYSIHGVIGYPELYKKFQLNSESDDEFISKRVATKDELDVFMTSKWASVWGLLAPVILPGLVLAIMAEGPGLSIFFLPFFLIILIPFWKAYKKRKKYIESRIVYTLKGKIWYDEERYFYRINDKELKLHYKWEKAFKKVKFPIENAEMEVLMHTFDTLDQSAKLSFQPIALKSSTLNINENTLKSSRSWVIPFLYIIASGFIVFLAPSLRNVVVDIRTLNSTTENLFFVILMTLIWWASILVTLYLAHLLFKRITARYFTTKTIERL